MSTTRSPSRVSTMAFIVSRAGISNPNLMLTVVTILVLCGIDPTPLDGHMGDPMYAAFDPLFW